MKSVRSVEEVSENIYRVLYKELNKANNIAILSCGNTKGLALHLFTLLKIARTTANVFLLDADYAYNILLPYIGDEIDIAILFTDMRSSKYLPRIYQSLLLNGIRTVALVHRMLSEEGRNMAKRYDEYITSIEIDKDIYRISILHSNLRLGLSISKGSSARIERMAKELELSSVVDELYRKYEREVEGMGKCRTILYTKSLQSVGEELNDMGFNTVEIPLVRDMEIVQGPILIMYTTAEEHLANELLVELTRKGVNREKILNIRINTDPLTAPIYGHILLLLYSYKQVST